MVRLFLGWGWRGADWLRGFLLPCFLFPCLPFPGCLAPGREFWSGRLQRTGPVPGTGRWVGLEGIPFSFARFFASGSRFLCFIASCFIAYHSRGAWHTGREFWSGRLRRTGPVPGTGRWAGLGGISFSFARFFASGFRFLCFLASCFIAYHSRGAWHRGESFGRGGCVGQARCQAPEGGSDWGDSLFFRHFLSPLSVAAFRVSLCCFPCFAFLACSLPPAGRPWRGIIVRIWRNHWRRTS